MLCLLPRVWLCGGGCCCCCCCCCCSCSCCCCGGGNVCRWCWAAPPVRTSAPTSRSCTATKYTTLDNESVPPKTSALLCNGNPNFGRLRAGRPKRRAGGGAPAEAAESIDKRAPCALPASMPPHIKRNFVSASLLAFLGLGYDPTPDTRSPFFQSFARTRELNSD